ncbi:MAG TPA: DNA adenine methylase [Bacteroidales bacterium]|nr:DNA adenine methylase [Bacteroidales bacterium]
MLNQLKLWKDEQTLKAPNVSQVPQVSPFRYPGGKTWFYPFLKQWFFTHKRPEVFIEAFAGGASMGLVAAIEDLADKIILIETNKAVSAVWEVIINGNVEWLMEAIKLFEVTKENVDRILKKSLQSPEERAFAILLRNRVSHGGIIAEGSGYIKYGENGRGIRSRWYPETLVSRIKRIADVRDKIEFRQDNAFNVIPKYNSNSNILFFLDPPYPKAGSRLYDDSEVDHSGLFTLIEQVAGQFLLTYDDSGFIRELAKEHEFAVAEIIMSTTHHRKKVELLINRNLAWLSNAYR